MPIRANIFIKNADTIKAIKNTKKEVFNDNIKIMSTLKAMLQKTTVSEHQAAQYALYDTSGTTHKKSQGNLNVINM